MIEGTVLLRYFLNEGVLFIVLLVEFVHTVDEYFDGFALIVFYVIGLIGAVRFYAGYFVDGFSVGWSEHALLMGV